MSSSKLLLRLLKFKGLRIVRFWFNVDGELELQVKPKGNGRRCPICGRRCPLVQSTPEERRWRDLIVAGTPVWLVYRPREILCPTHGRLQEVIPWARSHSRMTYRCEFQLLRLCQMMTQKAAAELFHIAPSTLSEWLHGLIKRLREGHEIKDLRSIGVDEISYCRGQKYVTIVYDLVHSCVIWVGKGKTRDTIDRFFTEVLTQEQCEAIQTASCDLGQTYIDAIKRFCPNAILVLDRFHVVKKLNEAVDEVRKEQWRIASKDDRKFLKGLRWILFRHSSNRSPKDTETLRTLDRSNRRIYRASQLKDEFDQFWEFKDVGEAEQYVRKWMTSVRRSRLEPMKKFVNTLERHFNDVLAFIGTPISNAIAEGLNRVIKIVKNRASGFRKVDSFTDMIYLTVGDLDLPAQIPQQFQII